MAKPTSEELASIHKRLAETEALRDGWEAMQLSLKIQGQLLYYLTAYAPAAVAMLDNDLNYMLVSLRWKQVFQLEEEPLIELPFMDFFPDFPAPLREYLNRGLEGVASHIPENRWVHRDGSYDWLGWNVHPWYDARGAVGGLVVSVEVVTEQKELSLTLENLNRSLENKVASRTKSLQELNEELKGFAHNVSHDLRTPLVNITGFVQEIAYNIDQLKSSLLDRSDLPEEARHILDTELPESLDYISLATRQMDRLLEALRRLASLGRRHLEFSFVDMTELVKRVCETQAHSITERDAIVNLNTLPTVHSDYLALSQIFSNLLSNSLKYSTPGRRPEIEIYGKETEDQVIYYLQDNGRGIPPEKADYIFHPFTRLVSFRESRGEGMGLAFVKTLVRQLKGQIRFEPNRDYGVTFILRLPK